MIENDHLNGHDEQGNVHCPYVTRHCPQGGTGHGGRENANGDVHEVTRTATTRTGTGAHTA